MAVLPVSVAVFVVGFSAGVAQSIMGNGSIRNVERNGVDFRVSDEKMRDLGAVFDKLEVKISDLENGLEGGVGSNQLERSKIKTFLDNIEHIRATIGHGQRTVEALSAGDVSDGHMAFDREGGRKLNQKSIRKRKELGSIALDLVQYFGSLFQENIIGMRSPKGKDSTTIKGELKEQVASPVEDNTIPNAMRASNVNEKGSNTLPSKSPDNGKVEGSEVLFGSTQGNVAEKARNVKMVTDHSEAVQIGKKPSHSRDGRYNNHILSYDEELDGLNASLHFTSKQGSYQKMIFNHNYGRVMQNGMQNFADNRTSHGTTKSMDFFTESETSSLLEQTFEIHDKLYSNSLGSNSNKVRVEKTGPHGSKEADVKFEDPSVQQSVHHNGMEEGNMSSSSMHSSDDEFNQNVKEASELLKQARECMMNRADEARADAILYKTARLLSTAVALKPMSLLAVGQLGNAYLLHGELKLKISRELRILLSRSDTILSGKGRSFWFKKLDTRVLSRENVASALTNVCEECEELFVEAGRNYRVALSIDGNDVRTLYNWGLALSFRAQLIADIGPDAALDADKVYMAAIDKFDAMMSRSNAYAPNALYRWGMALQNRSHLRPHNSKERMKLLQQAKSLFEDVLRVESDNKLVREALSSCISELKYKGQ
uniref:Uncharacterized protein LOC105058999 n=1 Tax=Elaeis guineensis var. tenera TaxID=51953 RepID=A0A6I9SBI0_ELAGV|nr:uncharacterized protein LOC105058999 [Elaeis guineensis]